MSDDCGACDGKNLWEWSRLKIRLYTFRQSTVPQKQFINRYHIFRTSFNIIWKKIFVTNFPILMHSFNLPTTSTANICYIWWIFFSWCTLSDCSTLHSESKSKSNNAYSVISVNTVFLEGDKNNENIALFLLGNLKCGCRRSLHILLWEQRILFVCFWMIRHKN